MGELDAASLPDLLWCLARLQYQPCEEWMGQCLAQVRVWGGVRGGGGGTGRGTEKRRGGEGGEEEVG